MKRHGVLLTAAAIATGLTIALTGRNLKMALRGKMVLITGGSRGLGLALARGFAKLGSHLILCARNEEELAAARRDLESFPVQVTTIVCDVTDPQQVQNLVDSTLQRYRRIDVLVNNAGSITVGPIDSMTIDDFKTAMDVMFWGPVHTTLAVAPHMRARRVGRIVNITSIGGKVAVPHLIPYSCAKFAAAAFSEGMRSELQGSGVKVVTIAPGLMRTGSHLNAHFKGSQNGEAAWFSLGASLPGISMDADQAASQIICATISGKAEHILSVPANFLSKFHGLFPGATSDLLGLVNRLLPHGKSKTDVRGADAPVLKSQWLQALTALGQQAAHKYLQPGITNQSRA